MLLPTSMVAINCFGLAKKIESMEDENWFFVLSTSNRSLFEVIKAISMPEKKAEKRMVIKMETLNSKGILFKSYEFTIRNVRLKL